MASRADGAVTRASELPESEQAALNAVAAEAVGRARCDKDAAAEVKAWMDRRKGRGWACAVGRSFGAYFEHEDGTFHHAVCGDGTSVLVWRCP